MESRPPSKKAVLRWNNLTREKTANQSPRRLKTDCRELHQHFVLLFQQGNSGDALQPVE